MRWGFVYGVILHSRTSSLRVSDELCWPQQKVNALVADSPLAFNPNSGGY